MKNLSEKRSILLSFLLLLGLFLVYFFVIVSPKIDSYITGMQGKVIKNLDAHQGKYVSLPNISKFVEDAAIASQDERFYTNSGIDLKGTFRAIFFSVVSGQRQGASTITEQLAKNVYFNDKDNLLTDIETKILALYITKNYSKNKILEMYLNDIYFGRNAYGIGAASKIYFSKSPQNLNLPESSYLIGLIDAPSYFGTHTKDAQKEAEIVLEQMLGNRLITSSEEKSALEEISKKIF